MKSHPKNETQMGRPRTYPPGVELRVILCPLTKEQQDYINSTLNPPMLRADALLLACDTKEAAEAGAQITTGK